MVASGYGGHGCLWDCDYGGPWLWRATMVISGKHTNKFTFLLDVNDVSLLYYLAIYLCILYAFIINSSNKA